jgi:steroid delta-isomerase-like uncharacterized protein
MSLFGQKNSGLKQNKETITTYFESSINKHDLNKFKSFFASNYIWHTMDGRDVYSESDSSHISLLRSVFNAIPDIHYSIENIVSENDVVAVNTTVMGTAKSEFFGLPPSLKKVEFKQMFFFRLSNNKITEEWEVIDMDRLMGTLKK